MTFAQLLDEYLDARKWHVLYPRDKASGTRYRNARERLNAAVPQADWSPLTEPSEAPDRIDRRKPSIYEV